MIYDIIIYYALLLNFIQLSFKEGMWLNWLYNLLEKIFRKTISKGTLTNGNWFNVTHDVEVVIDKEIRISNGVKFAKKWNWMYTEDGLLYIAKPIYACITCMPSIWCLPILFYIDFFTYFIVATSVSVLATLLYRLLNYLNNY